MNHIHAKCNTDNNTEVLYIGADVAKTKIDIAFKEREGFCHFSIPNTLEGMNTLVNKLRRTKACCHVILEPTGYYSRLLVYTLGDQEIAFSKINPRFIRNFARSQGKLSKTDKIDACLLSWYGELYHPKADSPLSSERKKLTDIHSSMITLIDQRSNLLKAFRAYQQNESISAIQQVIDTLSEQIRLLENLILEIIDKSDELKRIYRLLLTIKGIGSRIAIALIVDFPELGTLGRKEAAAIAGLAPREWESGCMRGRCSIQGGRPLLRKHVYMAALVASRYNEVLRPIYREMLQKGKKKKVALIAIARRLICYVNALIAGRFADAQLPS